MITDTDPKLYWVEDRNDKKVLLIKLYFIPNSSKKRMYGPNLGAKKQNKVKVI